MATARISESLWTCTKRWVLEAALARAGHRWGGVRDRGPMSGGECVARILAFLDQRSRSDGSMVDLDADSIEIAAGWTGKPGVLLKALIDTGWIDATPRGPFWHDYGAFNGQTIRDRLKKRSIRGRQGGQNPDSSGDGQGDAIGDAVGDGGGDEVGASGSGSGYGSESGSKSEKEGGARTRGAARRTPPFRSAPPEPTADEPANLAAARALATHLDGDESRQCSTVIAELCVLGATPDAIRREIPNIDPALGAFAAKRALVQALGLNGSAREYHGPATPDSGGTTAKRIDEGHAKAEAEHAAFRASGYVSRAEFIKDRDAGTLKPPPTGVA